MTNLIDKCCVELENWPYALPYVEKRLLERRTNKMPTLDSIRKTAEYLSVLGGPRYEECALYLLKLACTAGHQKVGGILSKAKYTDETIQEKRDRRDLLTAAIFTRNISLVDRLVDTHLTEGQGTFGDPFTAALLARNDEVLGILLATEKRRHILSISSTGTLMTTVRYGDPAAVTYMLQWNRPCSFARYHETEESNKYKYFLRRDLEGLLRTPNIEIFNIILAKLQPLGLACSGKKDLLKLLRRAIIGHRRNMAEHLILLGAPINSLRRTECLTESPLYYACQTGQNEIVSLLLDHGAQILGWEFTVAASHGYLSIIHLLLESGSNVHTGDGGENPCLKSTQTGRRSAENCLYAASRKGCMNIVLLLLNSGMDPNRGDPVPLVGAVESEHVAIFRLLVQRGAIVADALPEATKRAEAAGLESMLTLLREYGGRRT